MLQFIHNMGKNSTLCVNFCCIYFAQLYLQNHAFILKSIYVAWTDSPFDLWWLLNYWLILNMNLACDPTFITDPTFMELIFTKQAYIFAIVNISQGGSVVRRWYVNPKVMGVNPTRCISFYCFSLSSVSRHLMASIILF